MNKMRPIFTITIKTNTMKTYTSVNGLKTTNELIYVLDNQTDAIAFSTLFMALEDSRPLSVAEWRRKRNYVGCGVVSIVESLKSINILK